MKIVSAGVVFTPGGDSDFGLARYAPDGSLDPTFDGDGKVSMDFGSCCDEAAQWPSRGTGRS